MILTLRTDKPEAELGLYEGIEKVAYTSWQAHRELGNTLHERITVLCQSSFVEFKDISGIVFYEGPGSFTGLRIGAATVNALGYALSAPVVSSGGDNWIFEGVQLLLDGKEGSAIPQYGADAYTTKPKK